MIDMVNQSLEIGDKVIFFSHDSGYGMRGEIVGFNNSQVKIDYGNRIVRKSPHYIIKLLPGQS